MASFYEDLGLRPGASKDQIKGAYRRLALRYHPDLAPESGSSELFLIIKTAYEVLSDSEKKSAYDKQLGATKTQPKPAPAQPAPAKKVPPKPANDLASMLERLSKLMSRGQHLSAELLAQTIISNNPRCAEAYAVLGDISRAKNRINQAAKMYAFASQMSPDHPEYERRHIDMLDMATSAAYRGTERVQKVPTWVVVLCTITAALCSCYLVLSQSRPLLPSVSSISSLTIGLLATSIMQGTTIGLALRLGRLLDRFDKAMFDSAGRASPSLILGGASLINFWVAAAVYLVYGIWHQSYHVSAARLLGVVALSTLLFSVVAIYSPSLNAMQTLLWSGNLMFVSALVGWALVDASNPTGY